MRFAGTYHPIHYLVERLTVYLPGLTAIDYLFIDTDHKLRSSFDKNELRDYQKVQGQSFRATSKVLEWSTSNNPFTDVNLKNGQLSLEDEGALNVLQLFFTSPIDQLKDVIFISFSPSTYLKNLETQFNGISTQEKFILANLLSSVLFADYHNAIDERKILQSMESIHLQQQKQIEELKANLAATEDLYSASISAIVDEYRQQLESSLQKGIKIEKDVISFLAKKHLTINEIQDAIHNATLICLNLNISSNPIQVKLVHIQKEKLISNKLNGNLTNSISKENKVKLLLDKYEQAAKLLHENGIRLNAKNIAAHLSPPITPPAITDAVKKNNSKIAYFLNQFPDEWSLIRNAIKPIAQLDSSDPKQQIAS